MNDEIYTDPACAKRAQNAADFIREYIAADEGAAERSWSACDLQGATALVLGTGWGDSFKLTDAVRIKLSLIPGLTELPLFRGKERFLEIGVLVYNGRRFMIIRIKRVHMNEIPLDPAIVRMVRLHIEMLFALGATRLILTSGVGSVHPEYKVGDIATVDTFVAYGPEIMPLWGGEFDSEPVMALDEQMRRIALEEAEGLIRLHPEATHCYFPGPHFESREDKAKMRDRGAHMASMSGKPGCCIARLFRIPTLYLVLFTNDEIEHPDDATNVERAKALAEPLCTLLCRIVARVN